MRVGYGRFEFGWDGIVGYRLMAGGLLSLQFSLTGGLVSLARSSFSIGSFGCLPWFDFSLESELVFLAERSLLRSRMGIPYR